MMIEILLISIGKLRVFLWPFMATCVNENETIVCAPSSILIKIKPNQAFMWLYKSDEKNALSLSKQKTLNCIDGK